MGLVLTKTHSPKLQRGNDTLKSTFSESQDGGVLLFLQNETQGESALSLVRLQLLEHFIFMDVAQNRCLYATAPPERNRAAK